MIDIILILLCGILIGYSISSLFYAHILRKEVIELRKINEINKQNLNQIKELRDKWLNETKLVQL